MVSLELRKISLLDNNINVWLNTENTENMSSNIEKGKPDRKAGAQSHGSKAGPGPCR